MPTRRVCILSSVFLSGFVGADAAHDTTQKCRVLPGDSLWPADSLWTDLNETISGRLIRTTPLGSVCHEPTYDQSQCDILTASWEFSSTHFGSSSSIVAPFFPNASCDPFSPPSSPCQIGNYPEYSIRVHEVSDVVAGLTFAQKHNVRVIIKNTGHDLLGRSIGGGSLSIWTHYLQDVSIIDYQNSQYSGKAMKMGAGVQGFLAYEVAAAAGLRVVGGTCPTVGLAGGYTQGGGHSMLSTQYGLGADQVLEWEVVTAEGQHLIASPQSNTDLYWALSGGGPGTYGVIMSMTVKAWPDGPITAASLSIMNSGLTDVFWDAVNEVHGETAAWTEAGASTGYYLTGSFFGLQPGTFPSKTTGEVEQIMRPLSKKLDAINATYSLNITGFENYYSFFNATFGPLPYTNSTSAEVQGGSLVPRQLLQSSKTARPLTEVLRTITANPAFHIVGVGLDVRGKDQAPNAVLPAWRDSLMSLVIGANWNYTKGFQSNSLNEDIITNRFDPLLDAVTGKQAGSYMNEGNFRRRDFADRYYGSNYAALRDIKRMYDPKDLFYGTTLVGSEEWRVAEDGRLCRK